MNGCTSSRTRPRQTPGVLYLLLGALLVAPAQAGPEHASALFDLGHSEPAASGLPWNSGIHSTIFAVSPRIQLSGMGHQLEGHEEHFVALPAVRDGLACLDGKMMSRDRKLGRLTCRVIEIRPHGKPGPVLEATVEDIGPWSIADPYWIERKRPDAEDGVVASGRKTNKAGIDLSPALQKALGISPSSRVDWRFKTDADGRIVTETREEDFRT